MISREDATEILDILIGSELLSDDINGALHDILVAIAAEDDGLHIWGIPDDDVMDLYTKSREEFITDTFKEHVDALYKAYRYTPSKHEQEIVDEELAEEIGEQEK